MDPEAKAEASGQWRFDRVRSRRTLTKVGHDPRVFANVFCSDRFAELILTTLNEAEALRERLRLAEAYIHALESEDTGEIRDAYAAWYAGAAPQGGE